MLLHVMMCSQPEHWQQDEEVEEKDQQQAEGSQGLGAVVCRGSLQMP